MKKDDLLAARISEAKQDPDAADEMISTYMPFIRSETSKFLRRPVIEENDCELGIAMMAFYEAIRAYLPIKGAFFNYAALHIKSRLIDHARSERRHKTVISINGGGEGDTDDENAIEDRLMSGEDHANEMSHRDAVRYEIEEFSRKLAELGVSLTEVAEHCPRQKRTLDACRRALELVKDDKTITEELFRTKRLPIARLSVEGKIERKTLERHRKYVLALLVACTNGYEIIREHINLVLRKGE